MLDNSLNTLEKQIKSIEYQDKFLVITMMDNSQKVIPYSEEKLENLRFDMFNEYQKNNDKYLKSLDMAIEYTENTKVISFLYLLGSIVFLYNIDVDIETKIISGLCFASATVLYHLYKDYIKEKYEHLKNRLKLFSYYIENIEDFKTTDSSGKEDYNIHIEEINQKGMTLKKLKEYKNKNDMI